jgi:PAS domain S-box-containing protein
VKPTLALIDDSDDVRALVRTRLQLSGEFELIGEGRDGSEAISLAYRQEPDLMVLDISMPDMDGLEALPAILALSPDTRVVMFTGFEERVLAERAQELGAAGYVEKSLPIDQLPDRLLAVLGREQRHRPRGLRLVDQDDTRDDQAILDEHLERFREVFDQAAIGMATLTLTGNVVRANHALAAMMHCAPVDLVGVDYGQLSDGHGDELDEGLRLIRDESRSLVAFEHPLPVAQDRMVRVTLAPIRDSKQQPLYVFAQVQDISGQRHAEEALRLSEERFRLLVTTVRDYAIFMLDPDGHVASWNAGAERIKGYAAGEIIGQHFRVFYPPEEQEIGHPEENLARALAKGSYAEEGWRVRKDGTRFWASVVITALYDESGRHVGFAKVTRDQTDQREYAEQRQGALEQQAQLLAVTAHELRTPAAVVAGSASMLLDDGSALGPPERRQLLSAIATSGYRLQRIVTDMAAASRLERDALELDLSRTSLRAVLQSALGGLRAAHPGIEVSLDLPEDVTFPADAGRLGQAVDNLLENAVRHGQQPITVAARVEPECVTITVSDAGNGVPVELVPRLFERFAIAGPTGGTGLGLYLVRRIALGHDGDAVYRPPGRGVPHVFELTLPREQTRTRARVHG